MAYSWQESGTSTYYVAAALKNKFGYTSATAVAPGSGYDVPVDPNFYPRLQGNMQSSLPVQLSIATTTGGGHSIVCDGYNTTTDKYHLNYGWGSNSPTPPWWYALPSEMPSYSIVKYGILDIKPPVYVDPIGFCNGNTPCYTTIQSAINAARSGSVIMVIAGTYAENLDLNSSNNYELQGGWNAAYSSQSSTSSVSSMTFDSSSGTVTVGNIVVQ